MKTKEHSLHGINGIGTCFHTKINKLPKNIASIRKKIIGKKTVKCVLGQFNNGKMNEDRSKCDQIKIS